MRAVFVAVVVRLKVVIAECIAAAAGVGDIVREGRKFRKGRYRMKLAEILEKFLQVVVVDSLLYIDTM